MRVEKTGVVEFKQTGPGAVLAYAFLTGAVFRGLLRTQNSPLLSCRLYAVLESLGWGDRVCVGFVWAVGKIGLGPLDGVDDNEVFGVAEDAVGGSWAGG